MGVMLPKSTGHRPRGRSRTRWHDCTASVLWFRHQWCGASRSMQDCCWSWDISNPAGAAASTTLPRRQGDAKM